MCRHRLRTTFHRRTSPRAFRQPCRRRSRRTPRCRSPKRDRWLALVNKGWIPSWDEGRPDAKDDVDGNPSGSARVGLGSGVAAGRRPLRPDPSGDRRTALRPEGSVARRSDSGLQRTPCTEAAAQARGFAFGPDQPSPEAHALISSSDHRSAAVFGQARASLREKPQGRGPGRFGGAPLVCRPLSWAVSPSFGVEDASSIRCWASRAASAKSWDTRA